MSRDPLMSVDQLASADPRLTAIFDCGFDLADPDAGRRAHAREHIPGARHIDLERDLSGPRTGRNGRHPLPDRAAFAERMAALGLDDTSAVVAYDNAGGIYAARFWWMLRWAGHADVAVLDGGLAAWKAAGRPLTSDPAPSRPRGSFGLRPSRVAVMDLDAVRANLASRARLVIDARAPDRFRGENETLDPVGGHIPGARNRPFRDNLGADGRFKPAAQLRREFDAVSGGLSGERLVNQCGSGVTAAHNQLAMELAGLHGAALYPGSWSEWSAQPGAPIATGAN